MAITVVKSLGYLCWQIPGIVAEPTDSYVIRLLRLECSPPFKKGATCIREVHSNTQRRRADIASVK